MPIVRDGPHSSCDGDHFGSARNLEQVLETPEPGRVAILAPKEEATIRLRFLVACPPVPWHPVDKEVRK
jgi:hypothetical protein